LQPHRAHLLSGTAATTRGSQFVQPQPKQMANPVLEMETAGIAQVAMERGIPLLSLRAISDGPRAPIPFDLEAVMDEEYNMRIGKIIKAVLGHPRLLTQFLRMGRNTRKAAGNAAIALIAALSQPEPVISP
jgi:nucleoside phosphorylase